MEESDSGVNDLFMYSAHNLMEEFFPMYQNDIFTDDKLDEEQLSVFYKDMYELFNLCRQHNNDTEKEWDRATEEAYQFDTFDALNVYPNYNNYSGVSADKWPDITAGPLDWQFGLIKCITVKDYFDEKDISYNLSSWNYNDRKNVYVPCIITAVVKTSDNVPAAIKFVQDLICGESGVYENSDYVGQSFGAYEKYGMSVSRRSRKKLLDKYGKMIYVLSPNAGLFERLELRTVLSEEEYRDIEDIYANATEASYVDSVIYDIIKENLRVYIKDETNLEMAVKTAADEINLYLKEK